METTLKSTVMSRNTRFELLVVRANDASLTLLRFILPEEVLTPNAFGSG